MSRGMVGSELQRSPEVLDRVIRSALIGQERSQLQVRVHIVVAQAHGGQKMLGG